MAELGNEGFSIPFDANPAQFFKDLSGMQQGINETAQEAQKAGVQMTKAFQGAGEAADQLENKVNENSKALKVLTSTAGITAEGIKKALDGKAVGAGMEEKFKRYQSLLTDITNRAKDPVSFNVNADKLKVFEQSIEAAKTDIERLAAVVTFAKGQLEGMAPDSQEFKDYAAQIATAEGFLKDLGGASDDLSGKSKTLKSELRQIKEQLSQMELAGKGDTEEFKALSERAGELEDQIGDVSARVKVLASDTKYLDAGVQAVEGLVGGFAAAQGAAALFGEENEDLQKSIQQITAAMSVLQGIQAVANVLNKDSAFSVLFLSRSQTTATATTAGLTTATGAEAAATVAATTATEAFTAALLANPLVAVLAIIAATAAAIIYFATQEDVAKKSTEELNDELERQNEILQLDEQSITRRTNVQIAALQLLGAKRVQAAKDEGTQLKIQQETDKAVRNAQIQSLEDRLKLQRTNLAETQRLYDQENADRKKLGEELIKQETAIKDTQADLLVARYNDDSKSFTDEVALKKKREELAKQALQKQKDNAAKEKAILEQQNKYAKALRDAEVVSITNDYEKQRQQARNVVKDQEEALNAEKSLSTTATEERNKLIIQLRANLAKQLAEIDKKEATDRAAILLESNITLEGMQKESYDRQLRELKLSYDGQRAEIEDKYKNFPELQAKILEAINKAEIEQTKRLTREATLDAIDKETERQQLLVETAAKFIGPSEKVEKEKQLAISKVQLEGAKKRLEVLISSGEAENSLVVLQAKKQIQDLEKVIKEQSADIKGGGIDFQKLLFGDQGAKGNEAIANALKRSADSIGEITDFIVDQYQRQIDKKQELIDKYDEDIDTLEDQIEREKELQDQGYANNVQALEAELAAKKAARDEELRQQQEILKKQQAAAKAKFAVDTAIQASNLITASTQIFSSFAAIPFGLGIPLAIATVALMIGAFVAGRIKMYQAIQQGTTTQFGDGGMVDGKSHAAGGKKYRAVDDSGDVVELEGGEYVVNKKQTGKYGNLLRAMNDDSIGGMSDHELAKLFEGTGIHLPEKEVKQALNVSRERDALKVFAITPGPDISGDVKAMRRRVDYMADRKSKEVERWTDGKYQYAKRGNKVTRIKTTK